MATAKKKTLTVEEVDSLSEIQCCDRYWTIVSKELSGYTTTIRNIGGDYTIPIENKVQEYFGFNPWERSSPSPSEYNQAKAIIRKYAEVKEEMEGEINKLKSLTDIVNLCKVYVKDNFLQKHEAIHKLYINQNNVMLFSLPNKQLQEDLNNNLLQLQEAIAELKTIHKDVSKLDISKKLIAKIDEVVAIREKINIKFTTEYKNDVFRLKEESEKEKMAEELRHINPKKEDYALYNECVDFFNIEANEFDYVKFYKNIKTLFAKYKNSKNEKTNTGK